MNLSAELPVKRSENIVLTVGITKQIKFGDITNLRGKKVRLIETFRVADCPVAPDGSVLVADPIFNKAFLVLTVNAKEEINRLPLRVFNAGDNFGRRVLLNDLIIDWQRSYVDFGDVVNLVPGTALMFTVYYE